jgi:hypothetical protein
MVYGRIAYARVVGKDNPWMGIHVVMLIHVDTLRWEYAIRADDDDH